MVFNVIDYVDNCYSNLDGEIIKKIIIENINNDYEVVLSFKKVNTVSSSFVNSAFIELLELYNFEFIKKKLRFINSNRNIKETIKRRFDFEVNERKKLINA